MKTASSMTSPSKMTPETAYARAFEFYNNGNFKQAGHLLVAILKSTSDHPGALHLLGILKHSAGNTVAATNLIVKALSLDPENGEFATNLTEIFRVSGDLDKAVETGKLAVKLWPQSSNSHSNLGIVYYDSKEFDKAKECQQRALEIRPSHIQALNNMGSIFREEGDTDAAMEYYQKSLSIDPNYAESASNLGAILVEKERPEDALDVLIPLTKNFRAMPKHTEILRELTFR